MNIYDKNQEAYKNYVPVEESQKLFKISILNICEILVMVLLVTLVLMFGLLRSNAHLWITLSLYCLTFLCFITDCFHRKHNKHFLTSPKVYHDYYFCIYRIAPPALADRCLAYMAEICLIYGYRAQVEGALNLINVEKLKGRSLESHKRVLAVMDGRMNMQELVDLFGKRIKKLSEVNKKLSNFELLIMFIAVVGALLTIHMIIF